jgi:hypothetical protein
MKKLTINLLLIILVTSCASQIKIENASPITEKRIFSTNEFADLMVKLSPNLVIDNRDIWGDPKFSRGEIYNNSRRLEKL